MRLDESLNQLIRHTINEVLGIEEYAIRAKEKDGLRPSGKTPYADVDVTTDTPVGWEDETMIDHDDETVTVEYCGYREIMISVNFYRENAKDNARKFHVALVRNSVRAKFSEAAVGLLRRSEVRQLSTTLEDSWEERAQLDIFLSSTSSDVEIIRRITDVTVEGFQCGIGTLR